jgi:hypothetical protein
MSSERSNLINARPPGLVDVLDRILDKGLVIAGDIKVSLANVELLTLQIRLLVCSIDKAEQIGLNWWRYDSNLTLRADRVEAENKELRQRLEQIEDAVKRLGGSSEAARPKAPASRRSRETGAAGKGRVRSKP